MTQQEIEKKAFEAYPKPIRCDYPNDDDLGNAIVRSIQRDGYIKALTEFDSLPKIHGWVARDEDDMLHYFDEKPQRYNKRGVFTLLPGIWSIDEYGSNRRAMKNEIFPEITWDSEPVEVELIIRTI